MILIEKLVFKKRLQRKTDYLAIFFTLLIGNYSQPSYAIEQQWQDIDSVSVEQGRRVYDRRNRQYITSNILFNNSEVDLPGPLRLVITSTNHPIMNAAGTTEDGHPYFNTLNNGSIIANTQSIEPIRIRFKRIRAHFAYSTVVQKLVSVLSISQNTQVQSIPTLSEWGQIILIMLVALVTLINRAKL